MHTCYCHCQRHGICQCHSLGDAPLPGFILYVPHEQGPGSKVLVKRDCLGSYLKSPLQTVEHLPDTTKGPQIGTVTSPIHISGGEIDCLIPYGVIFRTAIFPAEA